MWYDRKTGVCCGLSLLSFICVRKLQESFGGSCGEWGRDGQWGQYSRWKEAAIFKVTFNGISVVVTSSCSKLWCSESLGAALKYGSLSRPLTLTTWQLTQANLWLFLCPQKWNVSCDSIAVYSLQGKLRFICILSKVAKLSTITVPNLPLWGWIVRLCYFEYAEKLNSVWLLLVMSPVAVRKYLFFSCFCVEDATAVTPASSTHSIRLNWEELSCVMARLQRNVSTLGSNFHLRCCHLGERNYLEVECPFFRGLNGNGFLLRPLMALDVVSILPGKIPGPFASSNQLQV